MAIEDPSPSFCTLPWLHLFADEGGLMYPCCRSVGTKKPNVNERGQPIRVHTVTSLEEAWNTGYMRTLRQDMLAGGRPKACERCYMYDDLGMRSHRQDANDEYRERIPALLAATDAEGRAPLDLRSVDLRLGNLCNLRCRMCSPQSSRALIGEFADAYGIAPTSRAFSELKALDWFASEQFWTLFERHSGNIERLHFAGGEPLMIPQMFDFLERLVTLGRAPGISLSYNTNATLLPDRVYDLWPHFARVRVTASIDGFGPVNSFIRFPSDWAVIDANLRRLEADRDRLNLRGGLAFNTTVQVFNIFRLDAFLDYVVETFAFSEAPNLSVLTGPRHFSIQIMTAEMKEAAAARLRAAMTRLSSRWPARWHGAELESLVVSVDGIIEHMMKEDAADQLPAFRKWCAIQDRHRQQSTAEVLPELAPLLVGSDVQPSEAEVRS